jgi:hypothetical protein
MVVPLSVHKDAAIMVCNGSRQCSSKSFTLHHFQSITRLYTTTQCHLPLPSSKLNEGSQVFTAVTMKKENCYPTANAFIACGFSPSKIWRRYVPPKRRLLQDPRDATSQKTAFFIRLYEVWPIHANIPVYKAENTAIWIRHADHVAHSIRKSCH